MNEDNPDGFIVFTTKQNRRKIFNIFLSWNGGFKRSDPYLVLSDVKYIIESSESHPKTFSLVTYTNDRYEIESPSEGRVGLYNTGRLNTYLSQCNTEEITLQELLDGVNVVIESEDSDELTYDLEGGFDV